MTHVWADRVAETSTTTGTGSLTLAGALTGFRTFASVCSTSDTFYYMVEGVDASGAPTGEWETGFGTYSGANTLARTTVKASSNSGSAVSLSAGTKRVALCAPAYWVSTNSALFPTRPPTTTLFSLSNNAASTTATATDGALAYSMYRTDTGAASTERMAFKGKAVPAGSSWDCTICFWSPTTYSGYNRSGLTLLENATGKSLLFGYNSNNGAPQFSVMYFSALGTYSSTPYIVNAYSGRTPFFLRITYDGTNYIFKVSDDFMGSWTTVATLAKASYFTADRVGVGVQTFGTFTVNVPRIDAVYYSDPDYA